MGLEGSLSANTLLVYLVKYCSPYFENLIYSQEKLQLNIKKVQRRLLIS